MDLMGNVIGKKIQERDIRSDHPKGCAELGWVRAGLQLIILLEEQVAVPPTNWQAYHKVRQWMDVHVYLSKINRNSWRLVALNILVYFDFQPIPCCAPAVRMLIISSSGFDCILLGFTHKTTLQNKVTPLRIVTRSGTLQYLEVR